MFVVDIRSHKEKVTPRECIYNEVYCPKKELKKLENLISKYKNALKIRLAKVSLQRNVNLLGAFIIRINLGKRKITRLLR